MTLQEQLEKIEAEAARLRREIAAGPCHVHGHDWQFYGGQNADCGPDCGCSVPVNVCSKCGFCAKCGRGIVTPAGQGQAVAWCYACGFDSGNLPLIEIPFGWSDFLDAITFREAQRMKAPDFDPFADIESRA